MRPREGIKRSTYFRWYAFKPVHGGEVVHTAHGHSMAGSRRRYFNLLMPRLSTVLVFRLLAQCKHSSEVFNRAHSPLPPLYWAVECGSVALVRVVRFCMPILFMVCAVEASTCCGHVRVVRDAAAILLDQHVVAKLGIQRPTIPRLVALAKARRVQLELIGFNPTQRVRAKEGCSH